MRFIVTVLILFSSIFVSQAQTKSHTLSLHFGSLFFMPPQWNDVIANRITYSLSTHKLQFKASIYALGGGNINAIRSYSLFNTAYHRSVENISGYRYTRKYIGSDIRVGYKLNNKIKHSLSMEGIVSYRNGDEMEILHVNTLPPYDILAQGYNVKQWSIGLGLSHRWYFTPSQRFFMAEDVTVQHVFKSEANVIVEVGVGMRLNKSEGKK